MAVKSSERRLDFHLNYDILRAVAVGAKESDVWALWVVVGVGWVVRVA